MLIVLSLLLLLNPLSSALTAGPTSRTIAPDRAPSPAPGASALAAARASLNTSRPSPNRSDGAALPKWYEMSPSTLAPSGRDGEAMAYDPILNAVVLFGGYFVQVAAGGDTWEFRNGGWIELSPNPAPAPRWSPGFVYDPSTSSLILFGGRDDTQFFNDTWSFTASGWAQLSTPTAPSVRITTMTYDASQGAIVLFGGGVGNLPAGSGSPWSHYTDTWEFKNSAWVNLTSHLTTSPPNLSSNLVYDAADGYDLLLGGANPTGPCTTLDFEWIFQDGAWSNHSVNAETGPGGSDGIWGNALTYDANLSAVLEFSGIESSSPGNCYSAGMTWMYSGGTWTNITTELGLYDPPARNSEPIVFDSAGGFALLFGGNVDGTYEYLGDTWALTTNASIFGVNTTEPNTPMYSVTFVESGLPVGAAWTVALNYVPLEGYANGMASSIEFDEPNGNFTYTVGVLSGWNETTVPHSGTVFVNGEPVSVAITFVNTSSSTSTVSDWNSTPAIFVYVAVAVVATAVVTALVARRPRP